MACGCTQQPTPSDKSESTASRSLAGKRNLADDERRGGHTLKRHVRKSDMELRNRLETEPNISVASTYTDRNTAELVVGEAISSNHGRIDRWLHLVGGHPNLVLDYNGRESIGRSLTRGLSESRPCSRAIVVLKWLENDDFVVLTSYPECR